MDSQKVLVCGISGRLPESDSLDELWNHLINKDNLVSTDCRKWDPDFLGLPKGSGMLKDLSRFDASFFGMLPKQVEKTEPRLRLLLEAAYEAIVDAGFNAQELKGSKTGVYVASTYAEASIVFTEDMHARDGYGYQSTIPAILANRLSYFFDLKGPSYTSCAACASGLLVLQNAMKDILSGECDYALVAGVTTNLRPQLTYSMRQLNVLAPDGLCKPFDESATGFARAEAVIAIFITRESLSRRAYGHLIHAVTNHCGFQQEGISFPSLDAQADLLERAYSESGISTVEVEFIEAHGTATVTGDPIETNAIHKVFSKTRSTNNPLLIGSIKSNMGHSEPTAGLAGLLKVLLTMHHGIIPPNLHFTKPKADIIGLQDGTLKVVTEPTKYMGGPIGVSAFGFGGVNAHVIVKPYYLPQQYHPCAIPRVMLSSGRTKECVRYNLEYLAASNTVDGSFHHLAIQVADVPADSMPFRGYKVLKSENSIEQVHKVTSVSARPIWLIFTGMGSQWPGMGKDLMVLETFRKTIVRCHEALEVVDPDINLLDLIMKGTKEKVDETIAAFVTTISIQVALVNCLKDLRIQPSGIIGHSMGETACAFADGLMTEEETIMAIYWRGRCVLDGNPPPGRMASVGLGWEEVKRKIPVGAVAACQNAENNTTVSGNAKVIENFVTELESHGVFARNVNTKDIAYHSPDMFTIAPALQSALDKIITTQAPRSPCWLSTSVAEDQTNTERKWFTSSYLVNNLVSPVRFYDAVRKIPDNAVVIEIAPHGLMETLLKRSLHEDSEYISLMNRKEKDNLCYFLSKIGKLFTLGVSLDLKKIYPPIKYPLGTGTPMLSPGLKWDHSTKWYVPSWEDFMGDRSVISQKIDVTENGLDSFVKDHNIDGRVLYPATGYMVTAWRAIADMLKALPENVAIDFSNVTIHRATVIPQSGAVTLTVRIVPSINLFDITENGELTVSGSYSIPDQPFVPEKRPKVDDKCFVLSQEDFYKELRLIGYNYGPKFQGVMKSTLNGSEAILEWNGNWVTFLDAMLQVTVLGTANPSRCLYLPTRIRSLRINPKIHTKPKREGLERTEMIANTDTVLNTCCSGGVEITGLHTSMAPKKQVKQVVTLESVHFVPYGKMNISLKKDVLEYANICKEYLPCVMKQLPSLYSKRIVKGLEEHPLNETKVKAKVTSYLAEDDSGFLMVLHEIGKLHSSNDIEKEVWNIIDTHAVQLTNDKLLSHLLKSHALKTLLDIVWENSLSRHIKVVELGARYGGLFIHSVPCMVSQPMLKLDFIAADTDLENLSRAFKTQLNELKVKTAFLGINGEGMDGFDKQNLVIVRGLAQQSQNVLKALQSIHSVLNDGGFLLLYEFTSNFNLHSGLDNLIFQTLYKDSYDNRETYLQCANWEKNINISGFELIQEVFDGFSSTMFLCRKRKQLETENKDVFIPLSGEEYNWVEEVKNELSNLQGQDNSGNIWLVSDKDYQSGIVGMINCLRQEDGGDKIRCIFNASPNYKSDFPSNSYLNNIVQTDLVMNVLKNGSWGSYRHQFLDKAGYSTDTKNAYVDIVTRGDLSSLQWTQAPMATTVQGPHQVLCTVNYSSLNFKDVMLASGKLPAGSLPDDVAHRECLIGIEFAGRDGHGKRVMGVLSNQGLATHVSTKADLLFDVPETWSLEDAATVPIVYSTVYYALVVRGQMKRGESILIHSGSGGVGQAAIAVALSYGCQVFTTVGTNEKRAFLTKKFPTLLESSFANSRDLSFERHILKHTNGLGVNLVLNSLSEELFDASLRCLSKFGRFLEIGKYDLSQNRQIGSSLFLKNISFNGIFLDELFEKNTADWSVIVDLMKKGIRDGVVQPLPRTVFARDEIEKAFRYMAKGKHIGKVLINVNSDEDLVRPSARTISVKTRNSCHPGRVYIIVGGLGGFGLEVADWLVSRDCKKLVLTSRSGIKSGYQARCVNRWRSLGVSVHISKQDTSEKDACRELIIQSQLIGAIGGIFNLAMVLKDALFENLTPEDFEQVCKPKINAANNLDQATRQLCGPELEWFVMFSSVVSGRGNEGQSNYGYANSAMERLCERRREDQLPGCAIQWGVIGDVGVIADSETGNDTIIGGCEAQKIQSCLSNLDLFLSYPCPIFSSFVKAFQDEAAAKESNKIDITQFVTKFFGVDVSSANQEATLAELGLDSLMAVEVKQTLERDFSATLSMRELRALTLRKLLNEFGGKPIQSDNIEENSDNENSSSVSDLEVISPILSYKKKDCLVKLNIGNTENLPIFLIHPVAGSIDCFRPLAKELSEYPVYAIQVTTEVPNESVTNFAKYYLLQMRSVQPDGPYNIAGYSFGALVALEIALLLQDGENFKSKTNLVLLDGSPKFTYTFMRYIFDTKYSIDKAHIQALGARGTLEVQTLLYFVTQLTKIPFDEIKQRLLEKGTYQNRLNLAVSTIMAAPTSVSQEDMVFSVDSFVKRTLAILDYQPKSTWNMDIALLKAKSCNTKLLEKVGAADYNLSKICSGEVKVHTIDGDHEGILQKPGLLQVANIIKGFF